MYWESMDAAVHSNLPWCSSTQWWHRGLGPSGTARARSRGRAWTHEQQSPTTCTQESAVTRSGFLRSAPETTSSWGCPELILLCFLTQCRVTWDKAIRSQSHPYLGWMSRKLPSWVRGTNLMQVPAEISCIPVSIVILSMSSTGNKKRLIKSGPNVSICKPLYMDSYRKEERGCREHRQIHQPI